MTIIFLGVVLAILCKLGYSTYKESKANKRLNEIYRHRKEIEDRKRRLIEEKPNNVIFISDLWNSNDNFTISFIGSFESLDSIEPRNHALAIVDNLYYFYKDGRWYELVDDISHLNGVKY